MKLSFGTVLTLGLGGALAWGIAQLVVQLFSSLKVEPGSGVHEINYSDLISITLTGVSIMLAILAFVVGFLAFFGLSSIRNWVETNVRTLFDKSLKEDGDIYKMIQEVAYRGIPSGRSEPDEKD